MRASGLFQLVSGLARVQCTQGDLLGQCVLCETSHLCSRVQHKCAANTAIVCVLSRVQVLMTLKSCIIIS